MFLTTIAQTGRLAIPHPTQDPAHLAEILEQDVIARESAWRMERVLPVPAFDLPTAIWASSMFYRCCQLLIYRDLGMEAITRTFSQSLNRVPSPSICYSADIAFAWLPDLFQLARGIAHDDPLILGLRALATDWPLSSVGIPDLKSIDPSPFIDDTCLRELYIQRVLERRDQSRLDHPAVRSSIRQTVGAFHELAPEMMAATAQKESA